MFATNCISALIKQFLRDVSWENLDFLIVDTPPGTSDEHLSIASYLKETKPDGVIIITTPQVRFMIFFLDFFFSYIFQFHFIF